MSVLSATHHDTVEQHPWTQVRFLLRGGKAPSTCHAGCFVRQHVRPVVQLKSFKQQPTSSKIFVDLQNRFKTNCFAKPSMFVIVISACDSYHAAVFDVKTRTCCLLLGSMSLLRRGHLWMTMGCRRMATKSADSVIPSWVKPLFWAGIATSQDTKLLKISTLHSAENRTSSSFSSNFL